MNELQDQLNHLLPQLRVAGTDLADIEVKDARGGFPGSVLKSVSAFANGSGGLIVLGLAEPDFSPTGADAGTLASALASKCADNLEPPIRPEIEICSVDGQPVVVALVDELDASQKPCSVKEKGRPSHAYLRTHDGNRRPTVYEHHALMAAKGQPIDDEAVVERTRIKDLDDEALQSLLRRVRETKGPVFRDAADTEILQMLGVLSSTDTDGDVTLAGLLALGRYPQQYVPRVNLAFAAYPTDTGEPMEDGTRLLDNQSIDGSIPAMLSLALDALRRNMRRRAVIQGLGREDHWDYPVEAIREVVVNALMHRDYHPSARGQPVLMALYPDRLEVTSPGGLYGAIDPQQLMNEPVTAARNARLAKLLQDVPVQGTDRTVCENVGSGLIAVATRLRNAGLAPPEIDYSLSVFKVVFRNHALLDEDALVWLRRIGSDGLGDRQQLGLAFARRNGRIDNRSYRALTGCSAHEATQDLTDLGRRELLRKSNDRRWAVWYLVDRLPDSPQADANRLPLVFNDAGDIEQPKNELSQHNLASTKLPLSSRLKLVLEILSDGPMPSSEIAEHLQVSRVAVHNWLRKLEERGLVAPTEAGRRSPHQQWALTGRDST